MVALYISYKVSKEKKKIKQRWLLSNKIIFDRNPIQSISKSTLVSAL